MSMEQPANLLNPTFVQTLLRDRVTRKGFLFKVLRGLFRRLPLDGDLREKLRQLYIRYVTGQSLYKFDLQDRPALMDGRWNPEAFREEQKNLHELSLVLRKEKW